MHAFEQTFTPLDPSRPVGIDCIDDRGYEGSEQNIKLGGAASYGLAYDTYAARMLGGNSIDGIPPVGEAAKVITKGLARHALLARLHHGCAAELNAMPIADEIILHGEEVYRGMNQVLDGSADESKFEQLQDFYRHLRRDTALFRGVDTEAACMEDNYDQSAIQRAYLAHEDHKATELVVNRQPDTWYDVARMHAAGDPRYAYDLWAVRPIAERIDTIMPHDSVEDFVFASVARVVATTRLLPRSQDQVGIDIVV